MDNEAYQTLLHIFSNESGKNMHFHGSGSGAYKLAEFIQHGEIHLGDAPDMLITKDNCAIIIEHFEFDSYHVARKGGSPSKREIERIRKKEDALQATEEGAFIHDEIKAQNSYEDYLKNVIKGFNKHYSHVHMYKENLKEYGLISESTQVSTVFLIEDTTPLGALAIERSGFDAKMCPITLAHCKEFLDLLQESPEIDGVLACSTGSNNCFLWFIDCAEIKAYYEHVEDYGNMEFLDFTPQVMGYKILIPENEISDCQEDL